MTYYDQTCLLYASGSYKFSAMGNGPLCNDILSRSKCYTFCTRSSPSVLRPVCIKLQYQLMVVSVSNYSSRRNVSQRKKTWARRKTLPQRREVHRAKISSIDSGKIFSGHHVMWNHPIDENYINWQVKNSVTHAPHRDWYYSASPHSLLLLKKKKEMGYFCGALLQTTSKCDSNSTPLLWRLYYAA